MIRFAAGFNFKFGLKAGWDNIWILPLLSQIIFTVSFFLKNETLLRNLLRIKYARLIDEVHLKQKKWWSIMIMKLCQSCTSHDRCRGNLAYQW